MNTDPPVLLDTYLDVLPWRVRQRIRADDAGCDLWTGHLSGSTLGGGVAYVDGRPEYVHRAVWRLNNGPLAPGQIVVRTCRKRRCVRIAHLRATTASAWLMAIRHGHALAA